MEQHKISETTRPPTLSVGFFALETAVKTRYFSFFLVSSRVSLVPVFYFTVTLFARFLGMSGLCPRPTER